MTYTTAGGGEVTDLAPYLGAAAHVAVVHESMSSEMEGLMTHTHAMPSDDTDSMGGMAHSASPTMDPCAMDVQVSGRLFPSVVLKFLVFICERLFMILFRYSTSACFESKGARRLWRRCFGSADGVCCKKWEPSL
jgi:hypothetical protein